MTNGYISMSGTAYINFHGTTDNEIHTCHFALRNQGTDQDETSDAENC